MKRKSVISRHSHLILVICTFLVDFEANAQINLIKDINKVPAGSGANPANVLNINNVLFYTGSSENGRELWRSNGNAYGTVMIRDIFPGAGSSNPGNLTNLNGTLFFTADDGIHGIELWKSDGTAL